MMKRTLEPVHVPGTIKGEETVLRKGHEAGRGGKKDYRGARDSTSINPKDHAPILPSMPEMPPS